MNRTSYWLIATLLFSVSHCAVGQDESSKSDDNILRQAQEISAATGRPIFAVAGRST